MKKIVFYCDGCEKEIKGRERINTLNLSHECGSTEFHLCKQCIPKVFKSNVIVDILKSECRAEYPSCGGSCIKCKDVFAPITVV